MPHMHPIHGRTGNFGCMHTVHVIIQIINHIIASHAFLVVVVQAIPSARIRYE